jgi:imidazolonepropionase-like amidohydrolase
MNTGQPHHALQAHQAQALGQPLLIKNARLLDTEKGVLLDHTHILIEGERIEAVTHEAVPEAGRHVVDAAHRVVMPGLIDCHVHVTASMQDLVALALEVPSLVVARSAQIMDAMLLRGFTSVRDAAGADYGLQEAVAKGLFRGPRLYIAGLPISQTGGHADMRPRSVRSQHYFCSCAGLGLIGAIADGVGQVRRQVREQIRTGANHIKIMAGGGVSSPSDPLEGTQFSMDELRAACEEAEAANVYAMAHAYSPRAVTRAVQAGVRSIEHGNLIDEATVQVMKAHGTFYVPTLSTYAAAEDLVATGRAPGWSDEMVAKLRKVSTRGVDAIRLAKAAGVPIVFGTDLLGQEHHRQNGEFLLRQSVMTPIEQLQAATITAARLMKQEAHIGRIVPGAYADLLMLDQNPLDDIGVMAALPNHLVMLMQSGKVVSAGKT